MRHRVLLESFYSVIFTYLSKNIYIYSNNCRKILDKYFSIDIIIHINCILLAFYATNKAYSFIASFKFL